MGTLGRFGFGYAVLREKSAHAIDGPRPQLPRGVLLEGTERGRRRTKLAAIVSAVLLLLLFLQPFQNLPFIDDWVYAWPVENLHRTGTLRVLEYSGSINVPQVLWGWLFTAIGGFSFAALRVSTFVLAPLGLWLLHRSLRALKSSPAAASLGVMTLAVYPIYFVLCFSFMTDVPFITCMIAAAHEFIAAITRRRTWRLVSCSALISVSVGLRFNGIAMASAMGLVLLMHAGGWGRRWRFLLALIPLVTTAGLLAWHRANVVSPADLLKVPNSPPFREAALTWALPLLPRMLPAVLAYLAADVGVALLPIALAIMQRQLLPRVIVIFVAIAGFCLTLQACGINFPLPLGDGQTWSIRELGATHPLVPGYVAPLTPPWIYWSIAAVGWASTAVLLAALLRRHSAAEWFLIWSAALTILMMAALWLLYDRYALPIAVLLAVLALAGASRVRIARAVPALVLYAVICVIGTRDHQAYNHALWDCVADLRAAGAKDSEIIGGYTVNGWLQYAHPENAPMKYHLVLIPWINGDEPLRFEIRNTPPNHGNVIGARVYQQWMGASGELFLVDYWPQQSLAVSPAIPDAHRP